ncbi:MAG: hypothetical protein M3Y35_14160 [Actinomycetota bacterium]|nr:hypothetical protein [Actinomycetota bacterium]
MLAFMQVWTIEVADAAPVASAGSWRRAHGAWLVEAALTHGAKDWTWVVRPWGVLVELSFDDEADWLRFRATPAVQAALDAAPDPVNGIWVYSGRGGSSAARVRAGPGLSAPATVRRCPNSTRNPRRGSNRSAAAPAVCRWLTNTPRSDNYPVPKA